MNKANEAIESKPTKAELRAKLEAFIQRERIRMLESAPVEADKERNEAHRNN